MEILKKHGVKTTEEYSNVRRWSIACVAWPQCSLAITESERALPGVMDELEPMLEGLDLQDEKFTVRMTGCPNGCARPYNADIGLVGKAKDRYTVFLGGGRLGKRLGYIYKDLVERDELLPHSSPSFRCSNGTVMGTSRSVTFVPDSATTDLKPNWNLPPQRKVIPPEVATRRNRHVGVFFEVPMNRLRWRLRCRNRSVICSRLSMLQSRKQ